jgi:Zn-dependent protease with chaperone function
LLALVTSFIFSITIYSTFYAWWRWRLLRDHFEASDLKISLDEFHRIVNKPFGMLYIIHFVAHLAISLWIPHQLSSWLQFLLFGLGSILATYIFQTALIYPWHKKLALTSPERFLKSALSYLRLTAALLAPFFIFQFLNATLFDTPAGRVDAFEVLVFTVGRIVILSLFTIVFSVMFMLKMIPNSDITELEHLELIEKRLKQIGWQDVRLRWIDIPDFNNAFVVGFKWFGFSNQTMFIGRSLRDLLTKDEFDAVICHELGHMANGHLLKRITYAFVLMFGLVLSLVISLALSMILTLIFSDDPATSALLFGGSLLVTLVMSYVLVVSWLFKNYREQEHEADAFAVMKLGIKLENMENALRKVANKFRAEARKKSFWNPFSTHPEIETRIENVKTKISLGVAYDWNQSALSRLLEVTFRAASPRALAMSFSLFILTGLLTYTNVQQNRDYLLMVERGDLVELQKFAWHSTHINTRMYLLFGVTPLEVAVYRNNLEMVKFLISLGADTSKGSGFSSPVDIALNQQNWDILDYLLGHMPDQWLESNTPRLFRTAMKEDSGRALETLLIHRLQRHLPPLEIASMVNRIEGQRSEAKLSALKRAGILGEPARAPASIPRKK